MIYPVTLTYQDINTDNGEEESYTKLIDIMFSDIQLDHKLQYEQREIIDINGVDQLYPFKISVSPRNKSTLFQQDTTWTCGPYTVVKVGLFRSNISLTTFWWGHSAIPFSSICANQRLVNEDWLTLGNMKFDIQHTVTLPVMGVSQVWNGVDTGNDILSYVTDTLLISFQDKKCLSYGTEDKVFWST